MAKTLQGGRFTLIERIGAGGMGEVWLAADKGHDGFQKNVVIKKLLFSDEQMIAYFRNEAMLGSRLNHANIVQTIAYFVEEGAQHIALEYVEGCSAHAIIEKEPKSITVEIAAYIGVHALRGLQRAHAAFIDGKPACIVHRDISPDNLLVSCAAEVKVADFGIAKASNHIRQQTEPGFKGKVSYSSPEAIRDVGVDQRSDIYSVGATLYELLSLEKPFRGSTFGEAAFHVLKGELAELRTIAPHVPEALAGVVHKMLAYNQDDRYASADEAREALQRAVPNFLDAEQPLAKIAQRISAPRRRLTSPYITFKPTWAKDEKLLTFLDEHSTWVRLR